MKFLRYLSWRRSSRRINNWLVRRQWKLFKYALPALLAILLLVVVLGVVLFIHRQSDAIHQRYHRLALMALSEKQYEVARVACLRGMVESATVRERLEWTYYLAVALNGLGKFSEAASLASIAAPLDHPGCEAAHLGIAQGLLSNTNLTTNILAMAERHLKNALILDSDSVAANELLGRFYINTHNLPKARERLMKIYSEKPEVAELIAITYYFENKMADGVPWADRSITAYEQNLIQSAPKYKDSDRIGLVQSLAIKQRLEPDRELMVAPSNSVVANVDTNTPPQDTPAFWLGMVRLLLLQGKFSAALETLDDRLGSSTNSIYRPAIAEVCSIWAEKIRPDQKEALDLRFKLIQKGLKNAPENLKLQLLLVSATHVVDSTAASAKILLEEQMHAATGKVAASWHFVMWTDARIRGDLVNARQHLKTAYLLGPDVPEIQNDMAMDLSTGSQEDLERGLKIIQGLLDKYPNAPGLRDTRGHILAGLGRNQEAMADLEYAVNYIANPSETRAILTKIYTTLGKAAPVSVSQPSAILKQVNTLVAQGKLDQAVNQLEKNLLDGPNSLLSSALADVCVVWLEKNLLKATAGERLRMIEKGLKQNSEQPKLRAYLIEAARANDTSGQAAKKILNQLVEEATGSSAAQWHLALGRDARSKGDFAAARLELQSAYEVAPHLTQVRTELASILLSGNQEDLNQALAMIQPVVEQFPQNPEFRNIRGQILAAMGRNQTAVADLEFAASKLSSSRQIHLLLAKIYENLNQPKQAEKHRQLAKYTILTQP